MSRIDLADSLVIALVFATLLLIAGRYYQGGCEVHPKCAACYQMRHEARAAGEYNDTSCGGHNGK